jgi:hypothetical protein
MLRGVMNIQFVKDTLGFSAILNLALGKGCRKKDNGKGEQN